MSLKLSPSAIRTFNDCQYKFQLLYILRTKQLPKPEFEFGTNIHTIISTYYNTVFTDDNTRITDGEIRPRLIEVTRKLNYDYDAIKTILDNFIAFESKRLAWSDHQRPLAIEKHYDNGRVHGFVDALFQRGDDKVVVDWKSGHTSDHTAIMIQGNIYMLLTGAKEAYFVYLGSGSVEKVTYDSEWINNIINKTYEAISNNYFERNEGYWCTRCEVSIACRLRKYEVDFIEI